MQHLCVLRYAICSVCTVHVYVYAPLTAVEHDVQSTLYDPYFSIAGACCGA